MEKEDEDPRERIGNELTDFARYADVDDLQKIQDLMKQLQADRQKAPSAHQAKVHKSSKKSRESP